MIFGINGTNSSSPTLDLHGFNATIAGLTGNGFSIQRSVNIDPAAGAQHPHRSGNNNCHEQ